MSVDDATLPAVGTANRPHRAAARWALDIPETALAVFVVVAFGVVFAFDVVTPADHVSLSFLYAIPLFAAVLGHAQPVYLYAALATALSTLGIFIQPPNDLPPEAFYLNRAIAVTALWIVAGLVATRKTAEALIRSGLEEERRKSEYQRRFLDVLSHEIGTSLTTIDGQAFRLRKLAGTQSTADVASRAEKIRGAVRRIESVVQRVQLASEAGQPALQPSFAAIDLRTIIDEAVQQFRDSGQAPAIETDLSGLPAIVHADPYMLRQVIDNLVSNAIKYSPPGAPVRIAGRTVSGQAEFSVIDRGRGVPDAELTMLFGPYYRASNSRGVHGAGIGLYVCERFVASHGGTIDFRSALGMGTTVTVRIPLAARNASERNAEAANPLH
jgi:signal transduction histidine kinase